MSKTARPTILGDLDLTTEVAGDQRKPAAQPKAKALKVVEKPEATSEGLFRTSLYMPHEVHQQLLEIAFHEKQRKVNALILEGIDMVLKSRRHPSIKELTRKAS